MVNLDAIKSPRQHVAANGAVEVVAYKNPSSKLPGVQIACRQIIDLVVGNRDSIRRGRGITTVKLHPEDDDVLDDIVLNVRTADIGVIANAVVEVGDSRESG